MAKPYFHAMSSAKRFGGIYEDYMEIHELMDSSKAAFPDNRHRALTHNSWFIGTILPKVFGETFKRKSDGGIVNTRDIGEQHILEDFRNRFIPTVQDYLENLDLKDWMQNGIGEAPPSHRKIDEKKKNKVIPTPSSMVLDGRPRDFNFDIKFKDIPSTDENNNDNHKYID